MKSTSGSEEKTTWLTLDQAAHYAGVCRNTIRTWRGMGLLHARQEVRAVGNGARRTVMVYDPDELQRRRRGRDTPKAPATAGETAAQAFVLFAEGAALADVVVRLQTPPQAVEELHDQWLRMGGSELVINAAAKAGFERIVGPFHGVADLLERVEHLANPAAGPG